ncbi:MAG: hypothetical protein EOO63_07920, partial [Hymenobacter sp.]
MFSTLLRRIGLLPGLVLFLLGLGAAHPAQASHLLGGEMTYKYLNANGPAGNTLRYEVTLIVYNTCVAANNGLIRSSYPVGIYMQDSGAKLNLTTANNSSASGGNMYVQEVSSRVCTTPNVPQGCAIPAVQQPYIKQTFVGIVNLPNTEVGYYAAWTWGARNRNIVNIGGANSEQYDLGLYCTLAPPTLPNSSPQFVRDAVANICQGDTSYILNNAVDPDGDELVYTFGNPYTSPAGYSNQPPPSPFIAPLPLIPFTNAGYNVLNPLGVPATFPGTYASVDPQTGICKYKSTAALATLYVVAVDVQEYRRINNRRVLIGTTRRDLQLIVVECPPATAPGLPTSTGGGSIPRNYTIEAGSTLTIPLTASQVDGHPLVMTATSVLLDGPGGYDGTLGGNAGTLIAGTTSGAVSINGPNGNVSGNFVFNSACANARATPYDIVLT